jgi:hypothetical protein
METTTAPVTEPTSPPTIDDADYFTRFGGWLD